MKTMARDCCEWSCLDYGPFLLPLGSSQGIDRARVEQMELRLKDDVLQEAARSASISAIGQNCCLLDWSLT